MGDEELNILLGVSCVPCTPPFSFSLSVSSSLFIYFLLLLYHLEIMNKDIYVFFCLSASFLLISFISSVHSGALPCSNVCLTTMNPYISWPYLAANWTWFIFMTNPSHDIQPTDCTNSLILSWNTANLGLNSSSSGLSSSEYPNIHKLFLIKPLREMFDWVLWCQPVYSYLFARGERIAFIFILFV